MPILIEKRIEEFLSTSDDKIEWIKAAVRKNTFLPLYVGWIAVLGIRPDGSFVRWDCEGDNDTVRPLASSYWQRMAICQGVKKYPELRALLTERPPSAQTCDACGGSGQLSGAPQVICRCGGTGWLIPGEPRDCPPG
jgi:hypothetical protein